MHRNTIKVAYLGTEKDLGVTLEVFNRVPGEGESDEA